MPRSYPKGPRKLYPNRTLYNICVALQMSANAFSRAVGWHGKEQQNAFYLCKPPVTNSDSRYKTLRRKLEELTGLLWEQIFPTELSNVTQEIMEGGRIKGHFLRELQGLGALPQNPLTPFDEIIALEESGGEQGGGTIADSLAAIMRKHLSERELRVLSVRFFESKSLEECGKVFKVTRERIRQIEAKGLRKLRHPSVQENLIPLLRLAA